MQTLVVFYLYGFLLTFFCCRPCISVDFRITLYEIFFDKIIKYIVDFYIPCINTLIELKDDHCWHLEQIKNGIWKAKMDKVNDKKPNVEKIPSILLKTLSFHTTIRFDKRMFPFHVII